MKRWSVCRTQFHRLTDKNASVRTALRGYLAIRNIGSHFCPILLFSLSTGCTLESDSLNRLCRCHGILNAPLLATNGQADTIQELLLFAAPLCYGCPRSANISARHLDGRGRDYHLRGFNVSAGPDSAPSFIFRTALHLINCNSRWL